GLLLGVQKASRAKETAQLVERRRSAVMHARVARSDDEVCEVRALRLVEPLELDAAAGGIWPPGQAAHTPLDRHGLAAERELDAIEAHAEGQDIVGGDVERQAIDRQIVEVADDRLWQQRRAQPHVQAVTPRPPAARRTLARLLELHRDPQFERS